VTVLDCTLDVLTAVGVRALNTLFSSLTFTGVSTFPFLRSGFALEVEDRELWLWLETRGDDDLAAALDVVALTSVRTLWRCLLFRVET
jgi:hypothetical protein